MKKLFFLLCVLLASRAKGQQDPLYAQYLNAPIVINPAYAGFSHDLSTAITYRKQWTGFDGSPQTVNASGHIALRENKMGAGMVIVQDKIGSYKSTEVQGVYAYHLPLTSQMKMSFGLQAGLINYKSDYSQLVINPNDPKFTTNSEWQPNFGAGLMLTSDRYIVALSMPKMLNATTNTASQGLYNKDFYALSAYVFQLTDRLRLKPFVLYRSSTHSKSSFDLGATLIGDDSYSIGLFTRSFNTYGFLAQLKLGELLRIGYVFELPTSQSAGLNFTSHEIQIVFRARVKKFHDIESIRNF